jgi:hypothetical protein
MTRRLFTVLSALSLLLCAATCVWWARSYQRYDPIKWDRDNGAGWLGAWQGHLSVGLFTGDDSGQSALIYKLTYATDHASPPFENLAFPGPRPGDTFSRWEWRDFAWYERRERGGRRAHVGDGPGLVPRGRHGGAAAGAACLLVAGPPPLPARATRPLRRLRLRPPRHPRPVPRVWGRTSGEGNSMIRRLFTLLSALSLVLCAATCALWVRSHSGVDQFRLVTDQYRVLLNVGGGQFAAQVTCDDSFRPASGGWKWEDRSRGRGAVDDHLLWIRSVTSGGNPFVQPPKRPMYLGFWCGTLLPLSTPTGGAPTSIVVGPVWSLNLPWAIFPLLWLTGRYRRRSRLHRQERGICPRCSYDLRGSPARCPECGAVPAAKGAA